MSPEADLGLRPHDISALTSALVEANDQLLGLYDLARATSNTLDERTAVVDVLERSARLFSADAMVLLSGDDTVGVGSDLDRRSLATTPEPRPAADSAIIDHETSEDEFTVVTADHASGLAGELRVLRRHAPFSTGDRKMLAAILRTALGAMSTSRLHQEVLRRALDSQDRQRAAEIAQLALPRWRPDVAGADLFAVNAPAQETGGDLFTFALDSGDLCFAVGDVSGKGLTAAVMMTTAICAANAAFRDPTLSDPGEQLAMISQWTYDHLSEAGLFITLFLGRYEPDTGVLFWANAGHSPCVILQHGRELSLPAQTPPLGVVPTLAPKARRTQLDVGDLVVIGSDGLVEQENRAGEAFGDLRLCRELEANRKQSIDTIGHGAIAAIERFADGLPPLDDRTLLLLRRTS